MCGGSYHVNEEPEALSDVGTCSGTARYVAAELGLWVPTAPRSAPVPGLSSPRVQTHPGSKSWVLGSRWLPRFLNDLGYLSSSLWTKGLGLSQNLPRCGSSPPHGIRE